MFGQIQLEKFCALTSMPQKAASAWAAIDGLVGASFKPLLYVGAQIVHGVNHYFIAEETIICREPIRRVVILAINELDGKYKLIDDSINVII